MSLINDALRQASASKPAGSVNSSPTVPFAPIAPTERRSSRAWLIGVGLFVVILCAGLWFRQRTSDLPLQVNAAAPAVIPAAVPTAPAENKSASILQSQAVPTPAAPSTIAAEAPKIEEPKAPPAPVFKLQAIYFRMQNPTVVINGQTLKEGERISGARLLSISRGSAEIELQGARQTLTLK